MSITDDIAVLKSKINDLEARVASAKEPVAQFEALYLPEQLISMTNGEAYAGMVIDAEGIPTHHLILIAISSGDMHWKEADQWAKDKGGELPSRSEQALLYANLKAKFDSAWYWSSEIHKEDKKYAWFQGFFNGSQHYNLIDLTLRACAVRRLPIQ